ncbi:hypothetical protein [Clostridium disporicum]|uniref:hypothetical protein n=1 Tax=Clostridium disporicum TaxID=84024 RepID=UPI0034A1059B
MINNILTNEDLAFLQGLAKELKAQDSRGTAKPLIYKIREEVVVTGLDADYGAGQCLISDEGKVYFFEDVCNFVLANHPDYNSIYELAEENGVELADEDYEGVLNLFYELGYDNWILSHFKEEFKFSGEFLTYESAKEHLEQNRHHYNDTAVIYTAHAWRNPLLENLVTIIEKFDVECELITKGLISMKERIYSGEHHTCCKKCGVIMEGSEEHIFNNESYCSKCILDVIA